MIFLEELSRKTSETPAGISCRAEVVLTESLVEALSMRNERCPQSQHLMGCSYEPSTVVSAMYTLAHLIQSSSM